MKILKTIFLLIFSYFSQLKTFSFSSDQGESTEVFYALKNNASFNEIEKLINKKPHDHHHLNHRRIDEKPRKYPELINIVRQNDHKTLIKFLDLRYSKKRLFLSVLFEIKYLINNLHGYLTPHVSQDGTIMYDNYDYNRCLRKFNYYIKRFNKEIPYQLRIILESLDIEHINEKNRKPFKLIIKMLDDETIFFINSNLNLFNQDDIIYLFNFCLNKDNIHILKIFIQKLTPKTSLEALDNDALIYVQYHIGTSYKCFKILVDYGLEDIDDINSPILYSLASDGKTDHIKYALKNGFDPNKVFDCSRPIIYKTPIGPAVFENHIECVRVLLKYGADVPSDLLAAAISKGHQEIIELLIDSGVAYCYREYYGRLVNLINDLSESIKQEKNITEIEKMKSSLNTVKRSVNKRKSVLENFILPVLADIVLEY